MLHGSGGSGASLRDGIDYIPLRQLHGYQTLMETLNNNKINHRYEVITPTANLRPYTYHGGEYTRVWFDRSVDFHEKGLDDKEDIDGINQSLSTLMQTINDMESLYDHIFLGGFSMGGGLVLHGLRMKLSPKVRGIFTMGSFLVQRSLVLREQSLSTRSSQLPLLMMHGKTDRHTDRLVEFVLYHSTSSELWYCIERMLAVYISHTECEINVNTIIRSTVT